MAIAAWRGATDEEYRNFTSQLGREGNERYIRAVADARNALARASAYEPDLRRYYANPSGQLEDHLDEIITALRNALAVLTTDVGDGVAN